MPRTGRIVLLDYSHHILHRGHNGQDVFINEDDYMKYLADMKELKGRLGVQVQAWCLLPKEVHLILNPGNDRNAMGAFMKSMASRFTWMRNQRENRSGTLWESRYRSSPVAPEWLLACDRHLEKLPLKVLKMDRPEAYPWTSFHERTGSSPVSLLDEDPMYLALADCREERAQAYKTFIGEKPDPAETALIHNAVERNQLTGGADFIDQVERLIGKRISHRGRGRPPGKPTAKREA
jgi:putative transposase